MRNNHSGRKAHIINIFLCWLELRAGFPKQSFPWRSGLSVKLMFPSWVRPKVHPSYWSVSDNCLQQMPGTHSVICHVVCPWRLHLGFVFPSQQWIYTLQNCLIVYFKCAISLFQCMLPSLPVVSHMNKLCFLHNIIDYYWITFSHLLR